MTEETFEYSLAALPAYLKIFTYFKTEQNQPCAYSGTFEVRDSEKGQAVTSKDISQRRQGTVILCNITGKEIRMNSFNQIKIRMLGLEDSFSIYRKWNPRWKILTRYSQMYAHFQLA